MSLQVGETAEARDGGLDLRSGRSLWELTARPSPPTVPLVGTIKADVVIVGAGITGSFIAERLTRAGRDVLLLDRHEPGRASTAASTALLQWEIDAPMLELEDSLGFEAAAGIYRRSFAAVTQIGRLVSGLHLDCDFVPRPAIYLAGNEWDATDLREEERLRRSSSLPSEWVEQQRLASSYGFLREAALVSEGSAEADPMKLASGLLTTALARRNTGAGARIAAPCQVIGYDSDVTGVTVTTGDGLEVVAEALILANGYEMPSFIPTDVYRVVSTWALATHPQPHRALWPDRALVWEASDPYCYMRTSMAGSIIIGGEDEPITDADARDALLPTKVDRLLSKLSGFIPSAETGVAAKWSGFFSETEDGLPMIGRVPGMPRTFAAFGYGGNGITFSAIAADMIERLMRGERDPHEDAFAIDR